VALKLVIDITKLGIKYNYLIGICFIYFNRMALEEDIDSMKVKASQDAATIHEMRVALEQEKEGKTLYFFDLDVTLYQLFSSFYSKIGT
jgi:hypothetical protein